MRTVSPTRKHETATINHTVFTASNDQNGHENLTFLTDDRCFQNFYYIKHFQPNTWMDSSRDQL